MTDHALRDALVAYDRADQALAQARHAIWQAVTHDDPELVRELVALFGDEDAAAWWLTRPSPRPGGSAAQRIANGQRDDVITRLRRAAHGMAG